MNLNTATTTISPRSPDKQFRSAYFVAASSPPSAKGSGTLSKTPSNGALSTLDPKYTPGTEGILISGNDSVNNDGEWSSAVGRASVAGKSGRVIERLMGDVDKLKRELNLAQARVEEEQSRSVSAREALDSLRGTKDNLEAICETNRNIIVRRDRKIDELKAELEAERSRRITAEKGRDDIGTELQMLKRDCEQEVGRAHEISAKAIAEYEIFKKSLQRMKADWQKQLGQMRTELDVVQNDRDSEAARLRILTTICDQLRSEQRKSSQANERLGKEYMEYRRRRDNDVHELTQKIADGAAVNEELQWELRKTLGEMKWVINVRKNIRSLEAGYGQEFENRTDSVG